MVDFLFCDDNQGTTGRVYYNSYKSYWGYPIFQFDFIEKHNNYFITKQMSYTNMSYTSCGILVSLLRNTLLFGSHHMSDAINLFYDQFHCLCLVFFTLGCPLIH